MKRAFIIVLDSLGAGEMPDARLFGDHDCHTLKRISQSPKFRFETLKKLGMGNIDGQEFLPQEENPAAAVCRIAERSMGKDTTIGHWEIAGVVSPSPMPTYPDGFPAEILDKFTKLTGRGVLCNRPYSGTEVIKDYGEEHVKTGKLIVYTSADSVFQIAAHEETVPFEDLYEYCRIARKILTGKHAVGRVIARPFTGTPGNYTRTANRHDFSLLPPKQTLLDALSAAGKTVYAIGKINDIFAGSGVTEKVYTHSNTEGMRRSTKISKDFVLSISSISICFTVTVRISTAMPPLFRNSIHGLKLLSAVWAKKTFCSSPPTTAVIPATTIPTTRASISRLWFTANRSLRSISAREKAFAI